MLSRLDRNDRVGEGRHKAVVHGSQTDDTAAGFTESKLRPAVAAVDAYAVRGVEVPGSP